VLRDYGPADLDLQLRLLGDPDTMAHLGGPETEEQIARRHDRYLQMSDPDAGGMFVIEDDGTAVGTIGYWTRSWSDATIWETGWFVLPEHRGRGFASTGLMETIAGLRTRAARKPLHAFPSIDNAASNAVCARAGLALAGPVDFEYPVGRLMRCNDWRVDLCT
jgi:RimJ/RimL family protein N-acetyltransferase